jgi:hypothetical protein
MSSVSRDNLRPLNARSRHGLDWRFLALAVLLHAGLLMLPVLREQAQVAPRQVVDVRLYQAPAPTPVDDMADSVTPDPDEPPQESNDTPAPAARVSPTVVTRERPDEQPPVPPAGQILDSLEHLEWREAEPGPAPIARLQDNTVLERLRRPMLTEFDNLFNGLVLPATAQVVDRWLEPGGVQRVVVRLPNGVTVCGRQEPVNDFRPWEQMPMMFHEC